MQNPAAQQSLCINHAAPASGAYIDATATRQIHPATSRIRFCIRRLTARNPTLGKTSHKDNATYIILHIDAVETPPFRHRSGPLAAAASQPIAVRFLDLPALASQTQSMAHTYLLFDFGSDEEKAQQARHKLESWKQAFRLDKKLLYKLDRAETEGMEAAAAADSEENAESAAPSSKSAKSSPKSSRGSKLAAKSQGKSKASKSGAKDEDESAPPASNGKVGLLVRLYFSGHEKLTEQRWLDRIPGEEPFKDASPRIIRQGEPQFDELVQQFESLE